MSEINNLTDVLTSRISDITDKHSSSKVIVNDNINISNIDIDNRDYSYDGRPPKTHEEYESLALARQLDDLKNLAFYRSAVNEHGVEKLRICLHVTLDDVKNGQKLGKPIRNPAALFNYKVSRLK